MAVEIKGFRPGSVTVGQPHRWGVEGLVDMKKMNQNWVSILVAVTLVTAILAVSPTSARAAASRTGQSAIEGNQLADSAPLPWGPVPSPSPSRFSRLTGVSCASSTNCMAVGSFFPNGFGPAGTITESWNGSVWTIQPDPITFGSGLSGVSCLSSTDCIAVGSSNGTSLIESWNGAAWSTVPSPGTGNLNGVSCTDSAHCVAVGQTLVGSSFQTLIETWDGSFWTVVPNPSNGTLTGVSCTSSVDCMAVGWQSVGPQSVQTLVESWDGTAWATLPNPNTSGDSRLFGVTCANPSFCMAVGSVDESWDGTTWTVVPNTFYGGQLQGVSCTGLTDCVAAGYFSYLYGGTVNRSANLVESWNGSSWSPVSSRNPGKYGNGLNAVSCSSSNSCAAVGSVVIGKVNYRVSPLSPTNTQAAAPFGITTTQLPGGTIGQAYSATLGAVGGSPPYRWKVVSGSGKLPTGLKLTNATGVITGVPKKTAVTSTLTIEVLDAKGNGPRMRNWGTANFTIPIAAS